MSKKQTGKKVLVGFAVDVSGSMEKSIRNESRKDKNRFESFRHSLKKLSEKMKQEMALCKEETNASIAVFSYAFGLSKMDYCDLLTLLEIYQKMASKKEIVQRNYHNPYDELSAIAREYGVQNMDKYTKWVREILGYSEARRLANRLYQYPKIAKKLTKLLPEDFSQIEERVKTKTAKTAIISGLGTAGFGVATGGVGFALGALVSAIATGRTANNAINKEQEKLEKPKALARELANASDDEVLKIIIREVSSDEIREELHKHGEVIMPLEKVADLLEREEKRIEDIKPLIYGETPMKGTMEAIQARFKRELARLSEDTVPILFILSDGAPTDGDPLPIAESLKTEGVTIVSCLITDQDLIYPRRLFDERQPNWTQEAILMYNMASSLEEDSVFAGSLKELGWTVPTKSKMFVQVNHSEILDEFIQIVLGPIRR